MHVASNKLISLKWKIWGFRLSDLMEDVTCQSSYTSGAQRLLVSQEAIDKVNICFFCFAFKLQQLESFWWFYLMPLILSIIKSNKQRLV